ncbi:phosphatidylinositol glycan, class A [Dendrobium catenatum]|uniref:Phosphatidylinositol glycan, class A n=1 Tax=Dendrobium catenatum TaxID=906689 RepID=A0A2I0W364_9ASPA|nr:phosphatidylinositol glycan, class A [Dendrobium catenatum]
MQNTLPTFYGTLPIIRTILIRERISVVHGHQAFSTLCHEALMHARTMGYKAVFTDHSLYRFADVGSIHMNKVLQFTLADIDQAICVSHTSKENTVLRSGIDPEKVFVIPNAVDTAMFTPAPKRLCYDEIVIVVISRLVYRKGADLLVEVIPEVCRLNPNVLPDDMIVLAEPTPVDMTRAIKEAIEMLPNINPQAMHDRVKKLYSWQDVAKRTEVVYDRALLCSDEVIYWEWDGFTIAYLKVTVRLNNSFSVRSDRIGKASSQVQAKEGSPPMVTEP